MKDQTHLKSGSVALHRNTAILNMVLTLEMKLYFNRRNHSPWRRHLLHSLKVRLMDCLFNDIVSSPPNSKLLVNSKLERTPKDTIVSLLRYYPSLLRKDFRNHQKIRHISLVRV